jgi:alanyl-tRNA synthetase
MPVYYTFVPQSLFCSYKLRRVMRKAMLVSQQKFGVESGLLTELTNCVADSLGEVYPEIRNRLKQVCCLHWEYCKGAIMVENKTLTFYVF